LRCTVKLGGSVLEDAEIRRSILDQIAQLSSGGHEIILVHGGGKRLNRRLSQFGIVSRFVDGLRVTDEQTLEAALMVLAGEVNKRLVAELAELGISAVGICGADASAVRCRPLSESGELGFVGQPTGVQRPFFDLLLHAGLIPVVASIALGAGTQLYNVNADQMASVCAWGTGSSALVFLTDVAGVRDESGQVISRLGAEQIVGLRTCGTITGGMLPKTLSCVEAIEHNVESVYILPGASPGILRTVADGNVLEGTCIHGKA
jgi:acetylglutamate kinase